MLWSRRRSKIALQVLLHTCQLPSPVLRKSLSIQFHRFFEHLLPSSEFANVSISLSELLVSNGLAANVGRSIHLQVLEVAFRVFFFKENLTPSSRCLSQVRRSCTQALSPSITHGIREMKAVAAEEEEETRASSAKKATLSATTPA